jgi:long-chain acyl-CoA synthetase
LTLGELLNLQCLHHGTREGLVIPWTGARWTYNELNQHSRLLAAALLEMGIGVGDRVGIMAGNCEQYASVFFAATRIGAILVILNNTYTPTEAQYGLDFSGTLPPLHHIGILIADFPRMQSLLHHQEDRAA